MAAATAAIIAGAAAAGATAYGAKKQADAAESAQDQATSATRRARRTLDQIANSELKLGRVDPATIPQFLAPLVKIFSDEGSSSIYNAFRKDMAEARSMLPEAKQFSAERDQANASLRRLALEAFIPGSVSSLETASKNDQRFLNFQLPEGARTELQRQAAEQAVRGGFASSGVQGELARARTFQFQMQNYWQANQAATARAQLGAGILGNFGLAEERLPAPGMGAQLQLQNYQTGLQQSMTNYQNALDAFRENQRREQSELVDRTMHERNIGIAKANLAIGQANAFQQSANSFNQGAAQAWGQTGQILGQTIGLAAGGILNAQQGSGLMTRSGYAPYAAGVGNTGYAVPRLV